MDRLKLPSEISLPNLSAIDWEKCVFCQSGKGLSKGALICPANNVVASNKNRGYITISPFLEQLKPFQSYRLPSGHDVSVLDEGSGIEVRYLHAACDRYKVALLNIVHYFMCF